jgi:hypothetical protein
MAGDTCAALPQALDVFNGVTQSAQCASFPALFSLSRTLRVE